MSEVRQDKEIDKLLCDLCGREFECKHLWVNEVYGTQLATPHCIKCFYDKGKCPDKHGYLCPDCMKIYPELNPNVGWRSKLEDLF
jgi:hypothetical protein